MLFETLKSLHKVLSQKGIDHALIGGLALGAHGVQRFTNDIDFLISEDSIEHLLTTMENNGYNVFNQSTDIIQFSGSIQVDIVIARRPISLKLLKEAKPLPPFSMKCVSVEGMIAFKIQAYKNDPKRELADKADIQALIQTNKINWKKLKPLAQVFNEWNEIERIRKLVK